jgi:cell division protein FtsQ
MKRKQARRRKQNKAKNWRMPRIQARRISMPLLAIGIVALCYRFSAELLDQPIRAIMIEGPFQRVTALQIEEAISSELGSGFFSADLQRIQAQVVSLAWIDTANVTRRWPGKLEISVTEEVPAAIWGERGLLNTDGVLFVTDARHVPAELPRLSGPDGQAAAVAKRYLYLREQLISIGLDVRRLHVDPRGAWEMTLQNGVEVRFGRREIDDRTKLFLAVAAGVISSREAEIEFVDMRYSNGFTIGWKNGNSSPFREPQATGNGLVAARNAPGTGLNE